MTEAKFLGVVFDQTLSYKNHVNYLKAHCLKALDILKVVGHTEWGDRLKKLYSGLYRSHLRSKLDYGCIVCGAASKCIVEKRPYLSGRCANCARSISYFSCNKLLCKSTRVVCEKQTHENVYELCFKTKNLP